MASVNPSQTSGSSAAAAFRAPGGDCRPPQFPRFAAGRQSTPELACPARGARLTTPLIYGLPSVQESATRVAAGADRCASPRKNSYPILSSSKKSASASCSEFNAQVIASPLPADSPAPALHCNRQENHASSPEPASICQGCFDRLQERVDVLEAAMHMDVKEAAQIVYDAVWADPSDPTKTYNNAAQALLTELKRRSGVVQVFGPLQPQTN